MLGASRAPASIECKKCASLPPGSGVLKISDLLNGLPAPPVGRSLGEPFARAKITDRTEIISTSQKSDIESPMPARLRPEPQAVRGTDGAGPERTRTGRRLAGAPRPR